MPQALEVVHVDQQTQMVAELDGSVMKCVHDQNGNHWHFPLTLMAASFSARVKKKLGRKGHKKEKNKNDGCNCSKENEQQLQLREMQWKNRMPCVKLKKLKS
ncbi:hypothetical protein ACOSP7_025070 [Xanthoceras sorbifolium]